MTSPKIGRRQLVEVLSRMADETIESEAMTTKRFSALVRWQTEFRRLTATGLQSISAKRLSEMLLARVRIMMDDGVPLGVSGDSRDHIGYSDLLYMLGAR